MPHEPRDHSGSDPCERMPARARVAGLLLCGGKSRRMGCNKAMLQLPADGAGVTFIESAYRALSSVACEILLSTPDAQGYEWLGPKRVADAVPDAGPIGGLIAGFEALESCDWVVVLPCDMPFIQPATLERILQIAGESPDAHAVIPLGPRGPEPLVAAYRPPVARILRESLSQSVFRIVNLQSDGRPAALDRAAVRFVSIAQLTDDPAEFLNINDPAQFERARRMYNSSRERDEREPVAGRRITACESADE